MADGGKRSTNLKVYGMWEELIEAGLNFNYLIRDIWLGQAGHILMTWLKGISISNYFQKVL